MKVTGRYAPKGDLSNVIAVLKTKNPSAILKENPLDKSLPKRSEWFVAKREFYEKLTESCLENCDEKKGAAGYFEKYLHQLGDNTKNVIKTDSLTIEVLKTRKGSNNLLISEI